VLPVQRPAETSKRRLEDDIDKAAPVPYGGGMNAQPAAYIRRSVARRGDPGDVSREFQTDKVRALANGDGPALRIIDADWGISAGTDKTGQRLAFLAMLDEIERGAISHVYAYSPDRLARSVEWAARLVNVCRRADVPITTTAGTVAPDDPSARAMFNMLAVMNETALDEMERKAQASVGARRNRGDVIGQRPYGEVRTLRDGRVVGTDEDVALIVATFREAGSYFGAARLLNERGVPARSGGDWYPRTVQRIVNREDRSTVPLGHRRGVRSLGSRLFSGLLMCPCAYVMGQTTSNAAPKYRCPNGVANADHSRPYMVSEAKLIDAMKAEAAHLRVPADRVEMAAVDEAKRAALEAKRVKVLDSYIDGSFDKVGGKAERDRRLAAIDGAEAVLDAAQVLVDVPQAVDWTQPPGIVNGVLRAIWERVELGPNLMPKRFVWRKPEWRAD
jgi:DNA invertase Pin-like site-specific DNA recombinase